MNKSRTPIGLCSNLVYQFKCNGCDATYIGETARHLCTMVQEHNRIDSGSIIAEHVEKNKCSANVSNFKILSNQFRNYWERVLYGALMIRFHSPRINIQAALSTKLLKVF